MITIDAEIKYPTINTTGVVSLSDETLLFESVKNNEQLDAANAISKQAKIANLHLAMITDGLITKEEVE